MTGMEGVGSTDVSAMASLEDRLAATLTETSHEVARMETLDGEERAEIYAILGALKADNEAHRALIDLLRIQLTRKAADA